MTQDSNGHPVHGSLNGRLDGWKEIAAHLGRGVRTAQRWERELGLPVRRLGTGGAEVVYALTEDLDAWLLRQSRRPSAQPPQDETEHAHAAEPRRLGVWVGLAGLALLLGLVGGWMIPGSPAPAQSAPSAEPAELEVVGNSLNARGLDHNLLWSHPFEVPLKDFDPTVESGQVNLNRMSAIGDFRGTGRDDVLLARNSDLDPQMYWFDHAGGLVRTHRIDTDITFGDHRCTSVRLSRVFAGIDAAEPRAFWIAGHELAGSFPGVLQALDGSGQVRSEYWSAGFIGAMAVVQMNGRRLILVGSAANETGGAALAVFEGAANGSSPAADAAYRCSGCPSGTPLHYLVFPRSRLQAELGHNAQVVGISTESGDRVRIRVAQAGVPDNGGSIGSAYYTFDSAFRLANAELSPDVTPIQRQYEAEKLVSPATRPRGDADVYPVLRWNGMGYDRISGPETR
ncbi:MAG: hypothetical protein MUE61_00995 [Vicinamibacterales bacterium]|jgi:hypothetical protein|nr:hypothetical protein [Vicinamibacterales bacterium]